MKNCSGTFISNQLLCDKCQAALKPLPILDTFLGRRGFFKKLARAADTAQHALNEEEVFRLAQLYKRLGKVLGPKLTTLEKKPLEVRWNTRAHVNRIHKVAQLYEWGTPDSNRPDARQCSHLDHVRLVNGRGLGLRLGGKHATGASLHRELVACDWNGDENEIPCNWNTQTCAGLGHLFGTPWIF